MPVTRRDFSRRSLLAALLPLGLAACAQSEASVSPFSEPERADSSALGRDPRLLVMTTRNATGNAPPFFGTDRGKLTFAEVRLSPPGRGISGRVSSAVSGDWQVVGIDRVNAADPARALSDAVNGRDVLLYVHGFNETFDSATRSAGQLSHSLEFRGRTVLFTWPSAASSSTTPMTAKARCGPVTASSTRCARWSATQRSAASISSPTPWAPS